MHILPLVGIVREKMGNISFNVFLNFMVLRNGKTKVRSAKVLKQIFDVFIKTFCREWGGEIFPKWLFIYKQLEKCQNEYYNDNLNWVSFCRRSPLHVLMFPISLLKRNLWSYWKWQTFEEKIWPFFMTSKTRDLFS